MGLENRLKSSQSVDDNIFLSFYLLLFSGLQYCTIILSLYGDEWLTDVSILCCRSKMKMLTYGAKSSLSINPSIPPSHLEIRILTSPNHGANLNSEGHARRREIERKPRLWPIRRIWLHNPCPSYRIDKHLPALHREKKDLERSETSGLKLVVLKGPRHEIFKDSQPLSFF